MLASRHPMFLWWGPELVQFYNDAYRPSFGDGGRHPVALAMRGADCWTEVWDVIGPQIDGVMKRGEATWWENQLVPILRNGLLEDVYWTYGFSPVLDDDGTIGGTLVVCQETTRAVQILTEQAHVATAERRARAALTRVFLQAPVAIAVLDGPEFRYSVANPAYQLIIGDRDPVGCTLTEVFPELVGSDIEKVLQNVFDTGTPFVATDLLIRFDSHGTGEVDNFYDLAYHPLMTVEGTVTGIVIVAVDVTHRRATLLERERLLSETARANRAKSEFLAVMSHELRTPLNAIGGYAELLEIGVYGPVTPEQRTALERLQRSQRHLLGLINSILEYAKVEAGAVHYSFADIIFDDLLSVCEALTAPQARARGLTMTFDVSDPPLQLRADVEKLKQILVNLISNALKFTEAPGQVSISCTAVQDDHGGEIFIAVKDTGRGIAPAYLTEIFSPFVQVDAERTRTTDGVGLGLAISRDFARGMGGELTVESEVGIGTTFTLRLPRSGRP